MKEIKAKDGQYLSQTGADGRRIYVTAVKGVKASASAWRNASREEMEAYTELEGCNNYQEILQVKDDADSDMAKLARKINYVGLTDKEGLTVKNLYPHWEDKIDTTIEAGFITLYNGNLWRARQTHTALVGFPPSLETASLYEVIVEDHAGTEADPIPYTPPMEIFSGKFYKQYDVLYKCTRDSGVALTHDLYDLRGTYVEMID